MLYYIYYKLCYVVHSVLDNAVLICVLENTLTHTILKSDT